MWMTLQKGLLECLRESPRQTTRGMRTNCAWLRVYLKIQMQQNFWRRTYLHFMDGPLFFCLSDCKCHFIHHNNPYLLIGPFKYERLHVEPEVGYFHDFISDELCQKFINKASTNLTATSYFINKASTNLTATSYHQGQWFFNKWYMVCHGQLVFQIGYNRHILV